MYRGCRQTERRALQRGGTASSWYPVNNVLMIVRTPPLSTPCGKRTLEHTFRSDTHRGARDEAVLVAVAVLHLRV